MLKWCGPPKMIDPNQRGDGDDYVANYSDVRRRCRLKSSMLWTVRKCYRRRR